MAEELKKSLMLYEIKKNFAELLTAFYIILIILVVFIFQKVQIISFLACLVILFVGIEKNATISDRCFSTTVCFILALGFMFM